MSSSGATTWCYGLAGMIIVCGMLSSVDQLVSIFIIGVALSAVFSGSGGKAKKDN